MRIRKLPVGRAWEALREDETACRSLGINPRNTKLTAFGIGAMFGGFAGSFFATRQGFISPESFTFIESAVILAIVVLGGIGSQIGVVRRGGPADRSARVLPRAAGVPHARLRRRHGADHDLAAARACWPTASPRSACSRGARSEPSDTAAQGDHPGSGRADGRRGLCSTVEHLTMRFGGLVAIDDVSFRRRGPADHGHHRPQRRRQDHGLQLPDRLLQADRRTPHALRHSRGTGIPARNAWKASSHRPKRRRRAYLPEHPPVPADDRAGEPDRRPAQQADARLGLHRLRPCSGSAGTRGRGGRRWRPRPLLAGPRDRACRARPTRMPATCPMASSGAWRSRAPCAPSRRCCASTSRRPA